MKPLLRRIRRAYSFHMGGFKPKTLRLPNTQYFGTVYGGWTLYTPPLDRHCVVYSFGVGHDISFDLEVINQFGCQVHAFDPTPISRQWIDRQSLPESFHFHPVGISDHDGSIEMFLPAIDGAVSCSEEKTDVNQQSVEVPVSRISTLMESLDHASIQILKMDIEGSETSVIDDLISSEIFPDQLLIEFHHRIHRTGFSRTRQSVQALEENGYQMFQISDLGDEFSFIHQRCLHG